MYYPKLSFTCTMTKLILYNFVIFIGLYALLVFVSFSLGFASKNAYTKQLLTLYSVNALIQIGINYFVFKKQIAKNVKILIAIVIIVLLIYTSVLFLFV